MRLRPSVLIVEDDASLRTLYRTALTLAGFDVAEASNGYDALRALEAAPPDLVILDLLLPVMSGHVVRQELAAQAHTRHIPVVIVTGEVAPRVDALDAECLLRKPVTPERLVEVVRSCLKARRTS
jgi:DNA-binding response OmpR family regulator